VLIVRRADLFIYARLCAGEVRDAAADDEVRAAAADAAVAVPRAEDAVSPAGVARPVAAHAAAGASSHA